MFSFWEVITSRIFRRRSEGRVPLGPEVIMRCRCGVCPVQGQSACSEEAKTELLLGVSRNVREKKGGRKSLSHEEFPGPYCSIGKAACGDLDPSKPCICGTCVVYKDYGLGSGRPVEHFCFNDKALKD